MEADNVKLEKQLRAAVNERKDADRVCEEIFAFLEDVRYLSLLTLPLTVCSPFLCVYVTFED